MGAYLIATPDLQFNEWKTVAKIGIYNAFILLAFH